MESQHGRSGKIAYYEHVRVTKQQASLSNRLNKCEPYRIQAAKIEPEHWRVVKRFLTDEKVTKEQLQVVKSREPKNEVAAEKLRVKKKVDLTQLQMETLVDRISRLPKDVDESLFLKQLDKLQKEKADLTSRVQELGNAAPEDSVVPFVDFIKFTLFFRELLKKADDNPELQTKIIRKLVHKIEITPKGFEVYFHVGNAFVSRELGASTPGSGGSFKKCGSSILTTGSRSRARTVDPLLVREVL